MALQEEFEQQGNWLFKRRGVFPVLILLIGLLLFLYREYCGQPFFLGTENRTYYDLICLSVSLLGLAVRVYTVGYTPARTSGRNRDEQIADTLNTTGIYSVVRHPLYLGNFLIWLGPAMLCANGWFIVSFALFYGLYYERIMFTEEQFLRRKFGDAYLQWSSAVPAFIPDWSKFRRSSVLFSWKKVIINEKNGLASIFIVFLIFDVLGRLAGETEGFSLFLVAGTVFSLLFLLVLKIIKMNSTLFIIEER